jgi:hypothetical protein
MKTQGQVTILQDIPSKDEEGPAQGKVDGRCIPVG